VKQLNLHFTKVIFHLVSLKFKTHSSHWKQSLMKCWKIVPESYQLCFVGKCVYSERFTKIILLR